MQGRVVLLGVVFAVLMGIPLLGLSEGQDQATASWDFVRLNRAMEELGYETTVTKTPAGRDTGEIVIERANLRIPVSYSLSGSGNYIWLTVKLKTAIAEPSTKGEQLLALLKSNFSVQPCQFYIPENGALMFGLAMENRSLTNAALRRAVEKVVADVVGQKAAWQSL